jgi:hypothetical protein
VSLVGWVFGLWLHDVAAHGILSYRPALISYQKGGMNISSLSVGSESHNAEGQAIPSYRLDLLRFPSIGWNKCILTSLTGAFVTPKHAL